MMETQTSRERVLAVLQGEMADRPPVTPTGGWWVAQTSGLPLPEVFARGEALAAAHLDVQGRAGYDAVYTYFDALVVPEAFGCRVALNDFGGPSIAKELPLEGTGGVLARPIPDPRRDGRLPEILKAASILAERSRGSLPVMALFEGPFTTASRLLGATTFLLAMMDDPELTKRAIAKAADALIAFGRALAAAGADAIIMPDPVTSTDLVSPDQSAEFAFPEIRRVIEALPVPVILHICGKTLPILGAMASSGARLLSLDQAVDLREARRAVGWQVALGGNVDPVRLMEKGTPEEVMAAGRAAIAAAGPRRFSLMAGCALPPATPLENVRALVSAARSAPAAH
ncbi:MAG TPA: uroporphyrinogen decarboxylase family protein [Candidatus Sulfotelmatobacter sp.]|nr:uroporphyrinogen decarboxylase family protein [Candidatus Sulfotelmatobacter sp.]